MAAKLRWGRGLAVVLLVLAGCGSRPVSAYGSVDVMFAQMSLAYIDQGERVLGPVVERAADAKLRVLAVELREQWRAEAQTMQSWLSAWGQSAAADPGPEAHAGHGELHSLRDADLAELTAATDFDGTATRLLLGHLHNCVAVSRMEEAGGKHAAARELAGRMSASRQGQIQRLLTLGR
ncbi:DUF305 domain-containing protein [Actinoplanes sp. NPDC051859]|uniref:DUF305 domain-containing protein n=1 Tax=Actinoplanes sp. NPDC051859 TaxID=3363909 RepID=UPI0037898661